MTVSASHRLMVELSMQEGEFTTGIGFANAALDTFRANLKKMAAESKAAAAQVQASMTGIAASAKAQVATASAAANAIKRTNQTIQNTGQQSRTTFTKVLDLANRNKVAWNQTANRIAVAGAVMVGVFGAVTVGYAKFEQALDQATAVIDVSIYDIQRLSDAAIEAGRTSQFSATEAAAGIEALAKAGVKATEIYGGALQGAINLAAAGGISLAEAAETASIMMIQFNKSGAEVPHIADLLAAAAGKAVGDVHDLVMALKQGGLIASQFGLSMEDTASTLALFAQNGLLGSDAGTSLKIMLLRLAAPATRAQKEMAKLGIDVWDANGAFIGMEKFAGQLQEKLGGLTDEEKDHALSVIFGTDAMRSASIMLKEGANGYRQMAEAVNDTGFAYEVMQKRMDNLAGDLKRLSGAWDSLVVSAGTGSNSALRGMTQNMTGLVNAISRMDPATLNAMTQAILGIGTGGLVVAGLMKMVIGINNFRKAVGGSNGQFGTFLANIKNTPRAFGIAAAALVAYSIVLGEAEHQTRSIVGTTDELVAKLREVAATGNLKVIQDQIAQIGSPKNATLGNNIAGSIGQITDLQSALTSYKDYVTNAFGNRFALDILPKDLFQQGQVVKLFQGYDDALAAIVASGDLNTAQKSFASLYDEMVKLGFSSDDIAKAFPLLYNSAVNFANGLDLDVTPTTQDYIDILRGQMPPAIAAAVAHQNELNHTFDRTGVAALDAATKVRESITQMYNDFKLLTDPFDARAAFEAAIDDTKEMVKQKRNELDAQGKLTKAAKEYRKEIKNLGTDWMKNLGSAAGRDIFGGAEKIANTGMQSLQQDMPNLTAAQVQKRIKGINQSIRDYAHAAGLSKAATDALIEAMNLVPETITTTFSAPGLDVTKTQAKNLKAAVDALPELASVEILAPGARPSKQEVDEFMASVGELPPEAETIIRTIAELGGVDAAKTAMANIDDVEAWIKTMVDNYGVDWWKNYKPETKTGWIKTKVLNNTGAVVGGKIKKADGGPIPGWSPNKRADNIPVAATAGEFMQPVDTVKYYGMAFMERLRRRMIPRGMIQHLAEGGQVRDRQFVQAPLRVVNERSTQIDNSRGDVMFTFPGARFGATPSEMMGAFGFAVNAGLASVGL